MSNSQYKDFITCEAMAMAKINGLWSEERSDALLVGSYVDAWLEGTLDEFKETTPELFKKNGELYAQYKYANDMINVLRRDEFCMYVFQGQKQTIMTAEFAGAIWKAKFDVYNPVAERIVDLKCVKSLRDKFWSRDESRYVSFVEAWGYLRQLAIYAEIERIVKGRNGWCEPLIVAVTKEDPPDKEIIGVDAERMEYELEQVKNHMERINAVKQGLEEPKRCESCKFCRATKQVRRVIHYSDLLPA